MTYQQQADTVLIVAHPVQNTWYPITVPVAFLNARLYDAMMYVENLLETLEMRIIADGNVFSGAQACVAGTEYCAYRDYRSVTNLLFSTSSSTAPLILRYTYLETRTVTVSVRKTTNNADNPLHLKVSWAKR